MLLLLMQSLGMGGTGVRITEEIVLAPRRRRQPVQMPERRRLGHKRHPRPKWKVS